MAPLSIVFSHHGGGAVVCFLVVVDVVGHGLIREPCVTNVGAPADI
jgi:hypothetical protein